MIKKQKSVLLSLFTAIMLTAAFPVSSAQTSGFAGTEAQTGAVIPEATSEGAGMLLNVSSTASFGKENFEFLVLTPNGTAILPINSWICLDGEFRKMQGELYNGWRDVKMVRWQADEEGRVICLETYQTPVRTLRACTYSSQSGFCPTAGADAAVTEQSTLVFSDPENPDLEIPPSLTEGWFYDVDIYAEEETGGIRLAAVTNADCGLPLTFKAYSADIAQGFGEPELRLNAEFWKQPESMDGYRLEIQYFAGDEQIGQANSELSDDIVQEFTFSDFPDRCDALSLVARNAFGRDVSDSVRCPVDDGRQSLVRGRGYIDAVGSESQFGERTIIIRAADGSGGTKDLRVLPVIELDGKVTRVQEDTIPPNAAAEWVYDRSEEAVSALRLYRTPVETAENALYSETTGWVSGLSAPFSDDSAVICLEDGQFCTGTLFHGCRYDVSVYSFTESVEIGIAVVTGGSSGSELTLRDLTAEIIYDGNNHYLHVTPGYWETEVPNDVRLAVTAASDGGKSLHESLPAEGGLLALPKGEDVWRVSAQAENSAGEPVSNQSGEIRVVQAAAPVHYGFLLAYGYESIFHEATVELKMVSGSGDVEILRLPSTEKILTGGRLQNPCEMAFPNAVYSYVKDPDTGAVTSLEPVWAPQQPGSVSASSSSREVFSENIPEAGNAKAETSAPVYGYDGPPDGSGVFGGKYRKAEDGTIFFVNPIPSYEDPNDMEYYEPAEILYDENFQYEMEILSLNANQEIELAVVTGYGADLEGVNLSRLKANAVKASSGETMLLLQSSLFQNQYWANSYAEVYTEDGARVAAQEITGYGGVIGGLPAEEPFAIRVWPTDDAGLPAGSIRTLGTEAVSASVPLLLGTPASEGGMPGADSVRVICPVTNVLDENLDMLLTFAAYDGGKLAGIQSLDVSLNAGESAHCTVSLPLAVPYREGMELKAFAWNPDGFQTLRPLVPAQSSKGNP